MMMTMLLYAVEYSTIMKSTLNSFEVLKFSLKVIYLVKYCEYGTAIKQLIKTQKGNYIREVKQKYFA